MESAKYSRTTRILACVVINLCLVATTLAQDAQPEPPKIIRKSSGVLQASATKRVEPVFPPLAKAARISGSVVVEIVSDEEGNVISARAISGHPLLKDAAVAAAKGWKFTPTMLSGTPVKVIGLITFNFNLVDNSKEVDALKEQIAANPNSAELYYKLGGAYSLNNENEKAIDGYIRALQLKPDYAGAYYRLGIAYKSLNRYEKAIEALKQALNLGADDPEEIYMDIARSNLRLNRPDEAMEAAKQALSIKPDFMYADEAHALVGLVLFGKHLYSEALDAFKEAARMSPGIAQIHLYLGMAYVMSGDRESAMKEYQILKEKDATMAEQLLERINKQQ